MRIQTLSLNIPLHPGDIPAFRSCIIEVAGRENEIFHNHDNSAGETYNHWGYPLVQYTVRAGRATIIGLGAGAEAIQRILIPKLPEQLIFAGQKHWLTNMTMNTGFYPLLVKEEPQLFGLRDWLALNKTNYKAWKATTNEQTRLAILSQALTGHLRVIAKAAGLNELHQVTGKVVEVGNQKMVGWHGTKLVRFHALAETNLSIPCGIGLGRVAAFGFGEVLSVRDYQYIIQRFTRSLSLEA